MCINNCGIPKKLLLIIDPQVDFISGTLPVPGAEEAIDSLAEFIATRGKEYARIIVSADAHPMHHSSFESEGGPWPRHCVADSVGAAVWPRLMDALIDFDGPVEVLRKGQLRDVEEYSIFSNPSAAARIKEIVDEEGIEAIDICGLAGDVCVARSLTDGIDMLGADRFRLLQDFTPSLDGGKTIQELTAKYRIPCVR